jgi:hypothetical protein
LALKRSRAVESTTSIGVGSFVRVTASESKPGFSFEDQFGAEEPETNADGTPRLPDRPHCAGTTRKGQPCMRVVLSHEADGVLYCSAHAPAGAVLVKWDPQRMPLCEGVLADGHSRCTRAVLEHVTVAPGVERGLCRRHLDNWATRQTLILVRSASKRRRLPAVVTAEEEVPAGAVQAGQELLTRRERPTDLREALRTTAEEAYAEIELGLREAIRSATKTTKVNCPSCRYTFNLQVRDWGSVIRASSELLDRVVSKPQPPPAPVEIDMADIKPEDVALLSNEQLNRLIVQSFPSPTPPLRGHSFFGDLEEEIRQVLDTVSAVREGHDVSPRRLKQAEIAVGYWNEMAALLAPFRDMVFAPEVTT